MFGFTIPLFNSELLLTPQLAGLPPLARAALLMLLCAIPLALLLWLYRYELRLVSPGTALGLLSLRLVVVLLILSLVCLQPIFARDWTEELPGRVLVVVDDSDSMQVTDPQRPPADKLRLARAVGLASDLAGDDLLDKWIEDLANNKEPRWLGADEVSDEAQRRQLREKRQQAYQQILERVDGLTRAETARRLLLGDKVGLLPTIRGRHEVEVLAFDRDTREVDPDHAADLFAEEGEKEGEEKDVASARGFTDLRSPLVRALEGSGPGQGKVLGIVLLTEGQHNAGDPPNRKARELGERKVPIYPIALGARKPPPDIAIVSVALQGQAHTVFKNVDAVVEVRFKIAGLEAGPYTVTLYRGGEEKERLEERTIRHDGKDREYLETFTVRMDRAGTQSLTATVRRQEVGKEEARADNNEGVTTVNVADDTAKVLVIDGEARWEYHYLATALERDRSMKLQRVVFHQPRLNPRLSADQLEKMGSPRQQLPVGPDALADFDCIILGDVSPEDLPPADRKRLQKYVADRGGTLVILAGKRFMPLSYLQTNPDSEPDPLVQLLPIEDPHAVKPLDGFRMTLTHAGQETRFLDLGSGPEARSWAQMPPHFWAVVGKAKPGATALAQLPPEEGEGKSVSERERENGLIVRHNYGFGRVLYVGLDSTWRWRYKVGDRYHHRFWGQAIRWAASDKPLVTGNEFVRFGTPQPVYRQGEGVPVVARFEEKLGALDPKMLAGARIVKKGAKEVESALVPLKARPAQPRVFEGQIDSLPAGEYAIELFIPDLEGKLLSQEKGREGKPLRSSFQVKPPEGREAVDLQTNWPLLEELALQSGGKVFTPEEAHGLAEMLSAKSVPHRRHLERKLWQSWWVLVMVVVLLTLEWAGRKWAGLP
jgi:hypothetical protein